MKQLSDQFRKLLCNSNREEDIQCFLKENPILLYPEFIKKWDKLPLAADHVTDFVFLINGHMGKEHVFVEIESPSKRIFTKNGLLSAKYTQAKDQLMSWSIWIDRNRRLLEDTIGKIQVPVFHLIIGRSGEIDPDMRWKLKKDAASSNVWVSTYDDILSKFEQTIKTLHA